MLRPHVPLLLEYGVDLFGLLLSFRLEESQISQHLRLVRLVQMLGGGRRRHDGGEGKGKAASDERRAWDRDAVDQTRRTVGESERRRATATRSITTMAVRIVAEW